MKILQLSSTFPRYQGDTTRKFIFYLCRELSRLNNEVHVISPHDNGAERFEVMEDVNVHRFRYCIPSSYQRLAYGSGITYNFNQSFLAKLQTPLFYLSEYYATERLEKENSFDIIHGHWLIPQGHIAYKIGKKHEKPNVVSLHGAGLLYLKNRFLKKICENTLIKSDYIIANSPYTASIAEKYTSNVVVIPQGVDTNYFKPIKLEGAVKKENKVFSLLYVGRLVERKGIRYLLSAAEILSKESVEIRIVGGGPLRYLVQDSADKGHIKFLGELDDNSLLQEYQNCDLFILPSIVLESDETETLGVVILEAMACGKAVIGTSVGGIPFIVKDEYNGRLIQPENVNEIVEAVQYYKNNDKMLREHSKNALNTAKKFNWKNIAQEHIELYLELINRAR